MELFYVFIADCVSQYYPPAAHQPLNLSSVIFSTCHAKFSW